MTLPHNHPAQITLRRLQQLIGKAAFGSSSDQHSAMTCAEQLLQYVPAGMKPSMASEGIGTSASACRSESVPALQEALREAKYAIGSMKTEAETAAQGDEQMMLEACEQISNEGLEASLAIDAVLGTWDMHQILDPALVQAAPAAVAVPGAAIAGALFDFCGYLTTLPRQQAITVSEANEASPMVEALEKWAAKRNLTLDDADIQGWRAALAATLAAVEVPAEDDPAALLQLAYLVESGRGMIQVERKEIADALRGQAATPAAAPTYIEVRECSDCGHIGINDADGTKAACNTCEWQGESPVEDKCPGCNTEGTMTTACPKCGARTSLIAETTLQTEAATPAAAAPDMKWRELFWAVARALNCLPSTSVDANAHVYLQAEKYAAIAAKAPAAAAPVVLPEPVMNEEGYLPCPFCGGDHVSLSTGEQADGAPWYYVECENCTGTADPEKWNERALLAGVSAPAAQAGVADEVNCVCGASWLRHGANDYEMTDTPRKAQADARDALTPAKPVHPKGMTSINARLSFNMGWMACERHHGIRAEDVEQAVATDAAIAAAKGE